jgi:hypothetical protein
MGNRRGVTSGEWKKRLECWIDEGNLALILPEVAALADVPQPPEFHPEGDVLTHTLLAVEQVPDDADERIFWAVLLHDIGKRETTCFFDGRLRAHGHARSGSKLVSDIMGRFGLENISDDVAWLVDNHHFHHAWNLKPRQSLSPRQQRFTMHPLFRLLEQVCTADSQGRGR